MKYVFDFHEFESVLDIDLSFFEFGFDEGITSIEMRAEAAVSVDDCEARISPGEFAIKGEFVPDFLGEEEVVVLEGAVEGCWGNVEDGLASLEVVEVAGRLGAGGPPGRVILVAEEVGAKINPGIFEALDRLEVVVHASGDDELIVLNAAPIPENYFVILRHVLSDGLAFRRHCELVHVVLGVTLHFELGVSES